MDTQAREYGPPLTQRVLQLACTGLPVRWRKNRIPTQRGFHRVGLEHLEPRLLLSASVDWSTYLGGQVNEIGVGTAVDSVGNVYIAGETQDGWDQMFGEIPGWDQPDPYKGGANDAFLARLSPDGSLQWVRFIGASGSDYGTAVAVDSDNNPIITGYTNHAAWTAATPYTSSHGSYDVFVAKFDPTGAPVWSASFGGNGNDYAHNIVIDPQGKIYVAGSSFSVDWDLTQDATRNANAGNSDAFILSLSSDGQQVDWLRFLGGANFEDAYGIDTDCSGNVYVGGYTRSSGWVSGGFDLSFEDSEDGFLAKISSTGTHVWSTYVGSPGGNDYVYGVVLQTDGTVWTAGTTYSAGLAANALASFNPVYEGGSDAFVASVSNDGAVLLSASYLGGTSDDGIARGIDVDGNGNIWVAGSTYSAGWTEGEFDNAYKGGQDAFVAVISPTGELGWSGYLGGPGGRDQGHDLATDTNGNAFITGFTESPDTPASSAWILGGQDTTYNGGAKDAYVLKISPAATPTIRGVKFNDLDGDGLRDEGEPGLPGWTIYLDLNENGLLDSLEPSTVTLADDVNTPDINEAGAYEFAHLPVGKYLVAEVIEDGWRQTSSNVNIVYLDANGGRMYLRHGFDGSDEPFMHDQAPNVRVPHWSADRSTILYKNGQSALYAARSDGSGTTFIIDGVDGTLSPDGTRIVYQASDAGALWIVAATPGSTPLPLLDCQSQPIIGNSPRWSPDGTKIAFSNWSGSLGSDLFVYDMTMGRVTQLTNAEPTQAFIHSAWSPDATEIVVGAIQPSSPYNEDIWVMNASDGSSAHNLTSVWGDTTVDWYPSWSSDGHWIVFLSDNSGNSDIWRVSPDGGSDPIRVTFTPDIQEAYPWVVGGEREVVVLTGQDTRYVNFGNRRTGGPPHDLTLTLAVEMINEHDSAQLVGVFRDVDGDTDPHTVQIAWGDGQDDIIELMPGDLDFTIDHHYLDDDPSGTLSDTYTITVTVSDDHEDDTATTTITVNNVPPVAADQQYTTDEDAAVSFNVLAGTDDHGSFSLADQGTLDTHTAVEGTFPTVQGGTVTIEADGAATYTPAVGFAGADSFDFTARDDDLGTDARTVTLIVRNLVDLSGRVFNDPGNDRTFEPSVGKDAPLSGVRIEVWDQGMTTRYGWDLTNSEGSYSLDVNLPPGTYRLVEVYDDDPASPTFTGKLDGKENSGTLGGTVYDLWDSNVIEHIVVTGPGTQADGEDYNFAEILPSDVFGRVWRDFNNDGTINFGEWDIDGVTVELRGTDDRNNAVARNVDTENGTGYAFANVRPGTYSILETQPAGVEDGLESLGVVTDHYGVHVPPADSGFVDGNDKFSGLVLVPGSDADYYNFGERPLAGEQIGDNATATIGFWHNRNGQNLIKAVNGGSSATQLGAWLGATFPDMYGPDAMYDAATGADKDMNLSGKTNEEIADIFSYLHKRNKKNAVTGGPPKVDAQVMATALATYVTSETLAEGQIAQQYGFTTSSDGIAYTSFDVLALLSTQEADDLGLTPALDLGGRATIIDILQATNEKASLGLLYDLDPDGEIDAFELLLRRLANDLYAAINEGSSV